MKIWVENLLLYILFFCLSRINYPFLFSFLLIWDFYSDLSQINMSRNMSGKMARNMSRKMSRNMARNTP